MFKLFLVVDYLLGIKTMPRSKIFGFIAVLVTLALAMTYGYFTFYSTIQYVNDIPLDLTRLSDSSYFSLMLPLGLVAAGVICMGFWIGWTILTIKVVPPMPEIVDKKDRSKIKAFFLCVFTLLLGGLLLYGIFIRSFWALAIPSAAISLVILGAVFWVGLAIITTRTTLHQKKE